MTTNNEAEYAALRLGLEKALGLGATDVTVKADSQLVVRQGNGEYAVKEPRLVPVHRTAKELLARFERATLMHVPREENTVADALADAAVFAARVASAR